MQQQTTLIVEWFTKKGMWSSYTASSLGVTVALTPPPKNLMTVNKDAGALFFFFGHMETANSGQCNVFGSLPEGRI